MLLLQAELHMCRYDGLGLFQYGRLGAWREVTIDVGRERVSGGKFKFYESAEGAWVADQLRVANGDEPLNFNTKELQVQVGCWCVCGGRVNPASQ
jgi:hypothetical protein